MKTTLILRFSAMGDVAIAASVMREIAAQNPEHHFVFATRVFFAPFFEGITNLEVFAVDFNGRHKGSLGLIRLFNDINKKYKIDAVADLHDVLRSKLITLFFLLFCRKVKIATINKGRKEKRALCANNTRKTPLTATWVRYTEVFQHIKIKNAVKPMPLPYFPERVKRIGVSPFAQHQGKMYPSELMEKVLELLSVNYEIYLFGGGKREQELCEKWQDKFKNVYSLVGKYSLNEELAFISGLDVMLSMDSSGMHLASLCRVPCVSIWGATHPFAGFVGFGQEDNPQIQLDLPCRPCSVYGNKACKFEDYRCLWGIEPKLVAQFF